MCIIYTQNVSLCFDDQASLRALFNLYRPSGCTNVAMASHEDGDASNVDVNLSEILPADLSSGK